jgi:RimJ/RimL family protein N-acetyltransferase
VKIIVKELSRFEQPALASHFLALVSEDRRLRFGGSLNDHAIEDYVSNIDFTSDAVFGVFDDEPRLIGVAHLARGDGHAELGISVLPGHRDLGIGAALLRRAHVHARNWGEQKLFMHCLTENSAMMHLAKKQEMDIESTGGESDAWLQLPPADTSSYMNSMFEQRVALFDHALKSQLAGVRRAANNFAAGLAGRN